MGDHTNSDSPTHLHRGNIITATLFFLSFYLLKIVRVLWCRAKTDKNEPIWAPKTDESCSAQKFIRWGTFPEKKKKKEAKKDQQKKAWPPPKVMPQSCEHPGERRAREKTRTVDFFLTQSKEKSPTCESVACGDKPSGVATRLNQRG